MADFYRFDLQTLHGGDVVRVDVDSWQNVLLLDARNYERYRRDESFEYFGGQATESPMFIEVPRTGHWYVVGDLGGAAGRIGMEVHVIPRAA